MSARATRRGFVGRLGASLGALLAGGTGLVHASEGAGEPEPWMQGLDGRHRLAFDVANLRDGLPLGQIRGMLATFKDEYRAEGQAVSIVAGIRGGALPMVLTDAAWSALALGEKLELRPRTNVWAADVAALQARGVRFLACRNTIRALGGRLAGPGGDAAAIERTLEQGLLPDVALVPAMVVAHARLQERRFAYVYAG